MMAFARRYFPGGFFAPRYFPVGGDGVIFDVPQQIGPRSARITWASTIPDATFHIWVGGEFLRATKQHSVDLVFAPGQFPVISILTNDDLPVPAGQTSVELRWDGIANAAAYRVEEFDDPDWVMVASIQNNGTPNYVLTVNPISDGIDHTFRITPIGLNGNLGTPVSKTLLIRRHPDPPDVTYDYNNTTHAVTIAAA